MSALHHDRTADTLPGPVIVCVDELAEILVKAEARRATAQRAEIHADLSDRDLTALAVRSVYEPLAVGRTAKGSVVFCNPATDHDVELVDALRDAFDRTDPTPLAVIDDARSIDLTGHVHIPQYGAFVRELLAEGRHEGTTVQEERP